MQKVKPNLFLQLVTVPGFLILDFIVARYYPDSVLQAYPLTWIFLIALSLFCLTPMARKSLVIQPKEKPRFKLATWLLIIWIFELCLLAMFTGLVEITHLVQPELINNPAVLDHEWLVRGGLFPWAVMLCLAALMAYYAYVKNKDASLCTLIFPLFRSGPHQTLGITANMCARLNMTFALVSSFIIASLALAFLVCHLIQVPLLSGLSLENILCLTGILILMGHRKLGAGLFKVLLNRQHSVFMVLSMAIVLLAALLVLSSWILKGLYLHPVSLPEWLTQNAPLTAIYKLFLVTWLLSWCVLGGIFLAYVSRGHKIWSMIVAGLSLPLLVFLVKQGVGFSVVYIPTWAYLLLSFIAVLTLFYFFTQTHAYLSMLMQVYVAADDAVKIRPYTSFVINWIRMAVGLLYLYLPGGILLLGIMSIMYTLPTFAYLLAAVIASGVYLLFNSKTPS